MSVASRGALLRLNGEPAAVEVVARIGETLLASASSSNSAADRASSSVLADVSESDAVDRVAAAVDQLGSVVNLIGGYSGGRKVHESDADELDRRGAGAFSGAIARVVDVSDASSATSGAGMSVYGRA